MPECGHVISTSKTLQTVESSVRNIEMVLLTPESTSCPACDRGEDSTTVPEILQNLETNLTDESLNYNGENDLRSKLDIVCLKAIMEGFASQRSLPTHRLYLPKPSAQPESRLYTQSRIVR